MNKNRENMMLPHMILGTLLWGLSLICALGCWFASVMMTDAGGRDGVEDVLVMSLIIIGSVYFLVVIGSVIGAWIAYSLKKADTAQFLMLLPIINVLIYIVVYILLVIRVPAWGPF